MKRQKFEELVRELEEDTAKMGTAIPGYGYPMVAEGSHGWDYILLADDKGQAKYIYCDAAHYGLAGNSALYSIRAGKFVDHEVNIYGRGIYLINGKEYQKQDYISWQKIASR